VRPEEGKKHSFDPGHAVADVLRQLEDDPRCSFQELPFFVSHLTICADHRGRSLTATTTPGNISVFRHWMRPTIKRTVLSSALDVGVEIFAHRWRGEESIVSPRRHFTPRYIIRDRDAVYGDVFIRRLRAMGIRDRPTAPRSPWQNGYCERAIGSIRRDCLDHVVVVGERHLRHLLRSYATYYNPVS
jgi:Integrase core domain